MINNTTRADIDHMVTEIHQGSGVALEELAFYINECAREGEGSEAIIYALEKLLKL